MRGELRWAILVDLILAGLVFCGSALHWGSVVEAQAAFAPQDAFSGHALRTDKKRLSEGPSRPSCIAPSSNHRRSCRLQENRILDSVVRIEIEGPDENGGWSAGIGHGTVIEGRYLVTHNHFAVQPDMFEGMANTGAAAISLFRADGEVILSSVPPTIYRVVSAGSADLVLDFGANAAGVGFFEWRGLASAGALHWKHSCPAFGHEVAQVNWDGIRSRVDWVRAENVYLLDGAPAVLLGNGLVTGASGGGVFWRGYHIGNNWMAGAVVDQWKRQVDRFSVAALNTADMLGAGRDTPSRSAPMASNCPPLASVERDSIPPISNPRVVTW